MIRKKNIVICLILIASFLSMLGVLYLVPKKQQKIPSFRYYEKSKAYKLFLKVYNSDGHNEFVANFNASYTLASKMPSDIKFKFLLLVYLNCNLDAGNWLYFCGEIQDDDNFFWKRLEIFIKSNDFKALPVPLQNKIKAANASFIEDKHHYDVHL